MQSSDRRLAAVPIPLLLSGRRPKMMRALILGLPVLLGTASAGYAQVTYTFTSLNIISTSSSVDGINNLGQFVGSYSTPPVDPNSISYRLGFVVTKKGFTSFYFGPISTFAFGINDSG